MSLLDMLCCGFGAACLLFVLAQAGREETLARSQRDVHAGDVAVASSGEAFDALSMLAATLKQEAQTQGGAAGLADALATGAPRNVVFVVDTSGSMALDSREAQLPAVSQGRPSPPTRSEKWQDLLRTVAAILVDTPSLKRFAILRLNEGREKDGARCSGCALVSTAEGSPWLAADTPTIARSIRALGAVQPAGGANHSAALAAALELASGLAADLVPDAIVLLTDGLPNHGPLKLDHPICTGSVQAQCGVSEHPDSSCEVCPNAKLARGRYVLEHLAPRLKSARDRNPEFRLHVVAFEWPDDIELPAFGLDLARAGGGRFVFRSPSVRVAMGDVR